MKKTDVLQLGLQFNFWDVMTICNLWGNFLSLYSWFYEVIILGGTYASGEGKVQNVSLDVKLRL